MSIFNKTKTPVNIIRSLFFLMAAVCCIVNFFPMISYAEGVEKNIAVFSQNIYHVHTGNSDKGGGCYNVEQTGTKKETEKCNGSMVYWPATNSSSCSKCAAGYSGDQSHRKCWSEETTYVSYTYYDMGCGMSEDTVIGVLKVVPDTMEWTKKVLLTGSYKANGNMGVASKPYIWNGQSATQNNTYEVNASGNYTLQLNADSNTNAASVIVTAKVRNVDVTAPTVRAHTQEPQTDWTKDGVVVTLTDVVDLQPDGSEGCGLHEQPYSYDNGETWTVENAHVYMENGTHTILVRDKLENTAEYTVSFSNLDVTAPTILTAEYDDTKNIRTTTLTITAEDLQPDGSEGCGLHEQPYSYDRGKTWTAENSLLVDSNKTIGVAVRDKLENIQYLDITITNIDSTGPEIFYKLKPDYWTNGDVTLSLWAKDINEDGSEGVGLEDTWYSLDDGNTWSNAEEIVYEENEKVTILARDKHDNQSLLRIKIKNIDKELPWVKLSMNVIGAGADMQVQLTAQAGDDESGLHEEAYSWNKGCSYGAENTMLVTENGTYQVTVRDKAGNWRYALCDVDVFPIIEIPAIVIEETSEEAKPEDTSYDAKIESTEEAETETQTYVVEMEEKIEAPVKAAVQTIEEDAWNIIDTLLLLCILLLLIGLLLFLLLLWLRTIAVYAEDMDGNMKYMCRRWLDYKNERFEVSIDMQLLEKCETTHFSLRPSSLFVKMYEGRDISCLFPENICIIKKIEKKIDVLLL